MIIFINEKEKAKEMLQIIKNVIDFEETIFLEKLNSCDVYFVK